MSTKNDIMRLYPKFSKTQRRIADFFIQNAHQASGKTIDDLAKRINVSKATLVRFTKILGYAGFREFIINFTTHETFPTFSRVSTPDYLEVNPGDSIHKIMGHIHTTSQQSINQTIEVCNPQDLERAVNRLHLANRIDFFGMGACSFVAQDAQHKFLRINKYSHAFSDSHMQAMVAATLSKDDVCVIISYSGETLDSLRIAEIAKEAGATVISITKYGKNSISHIADIPLFVSAVESEIRSAALGSRLAQLCVIDIIYTAVLGIEYEDAKKYLHASRKALTTRYGSKTDMRFKGDGDLCQ